MRERRLRWQWVGLAAAVMMIAVAATTRRGDACVAPTKPMVPARGPWILWNTSPSVAEGLYLRTNNPLRVGEIVAACLPEEIATTAKKRGYLLPGSRCPGGVAPLLKRVAAVEGAWVELPDGALVIDDEPWPGGSIEPHDSRGRPVPWHQAFPFEVKAGEVLLLGQHAGSFDGRYFGPVGLGAVLRVYRTFWAWGEEEGDACVAPTP